MQPPPPSVPGPQAGPADLRPSATPPAGLPNAEERTWAMLAHLLTIFASFLAPLVIFLVHQGKSAYIERQAKEALNFQITMLLIELVALATLCIGIGILLLPLVLLVDLVLVILAAVAANRGADHRYPFALRLVT